MLTLGGSIHSNPPLPHRDEVTIRAVGALWNEVPQREFDVAHLLPGGRAQGEVTSITPSVLLVTDLYWEPSWNPRNPSKAAHSLNVEEFVIDYSH